MSRSTTAASPRAKKSYADRPVAAPKATPSTTGRTVTIYSKLPYNLLAQMYELVDGLAIVGNNQVAIKRASRVGRQHVINGNAIEEGVQHDKAITNGFAITTKFPADVWESWSRANAGADYLENHLVFAVGTVRDGDQEASSLRDIKSGLERLDQKNPGARMPRGAGFARVEQGRL
jgi:hypothetical protein